MDGLTFPGRKSNPVDFSFVAEIVEHAKNLEDLLVGIFAKSDARVTLTSLEDEDRQLMGMVSFPSGSEVYIAFAEKLIRKGRRLFDPSTALTSLADVGTAIIDPDWLAQRDKDFGVVVLDSEGVTMVRPSRSIDLILSYALSHNGQATITREFGAIARRRFGHTLELHLVFLGDTASAGYEETICLDWDKLVASAARSRKRSHVAGSVSIESM